ncbi:MAG: ABC transporter, permease protein (cluster 2, ribose/xylose/arabinose/galactose) [uncultured Thermomicrobiales bacterium]|uniref:Autoinducer 2 import system permease protein LsrD n=1 Tax=uncultured Thermomicrobiales bacterium TaxID=1645740 RepID=A0A6J4UXQ8_9BACT|nr:MAG: ABC transporter, permease protein (cluster 2, ribose/xylose/arabinose/galactose) [uncultured Thermomicrobiales bacterium]
MTADATGPTIRPGIDLTESTGTRILRILRPSAPVFIVLIGLLVWITIENPNFTDPNVFLIFLRRAAPLMILAAGQLFVIVSGEFDLSMGALITLVVILSGSWIDGDPSRTWPVILALLAIGVVVGLANGLITTRLRVPSFITTLGTMLILSGFALWWSGGTPKGSLPDNFRMWGRTGLEDVPVIGQLPYSVIVMVIVAIVTAWLLHATSFGKQVFASGGNPRAAFFSGVDVPRVRVLAFVISALSAVIAGILLGGFSGVSPDAGAGYEFRAISAVILGGAILGGGRGAIIPAMAGALTLEALFTLLNLLGLPNPIRDVFQGVIIIAAIGIAAFRQRTSR